MNRAQDARSTSRPIGSLDWSVECNAWPHAEASRFHQAGGLRWHVQQMGQGPVILLIHGTGASTHSWRTLAPRLAERFTVIALDLPGHGFTQSPPRDQLSLPAMAASVASVVDSLSLQPVTVVGHSAGAAILIRCCLDGTIAPHAVISLNGALLPFRGAAGLLFPPLARLLFLNPLTPWMVTRSASNRERVVRLIRGTGSELDETGIDLYTRLFTSSAHVTAALGMMANWDLHRFARELPALTQPLLLVAGENDQAVAPTDAERVCRIVSDARLERLPGLGHLAHEENASTVAEVIFEFVRKANGLSGSDAA